MRLVKHRNVVDLRAFFYSNGDKVCVLLAFSAFCLFRSELTPVFRAISTWSL